ncbi:MAG: hypothetical protein HFF09_05690 [Oscillospiraceae bacterium]|nr:hypothetical protein [Oscillospiraceae bacterium]
MKKRWHTIAALTLCFIALSGCFFESSDTLYKLPEASEDFTDLQAKINSVQNQLAAETAGAVEYAVPLQGDNVQTIQLQDLDDDGEQESAVAFFRVPGADKPLRIYIFTRNGESGYQEAFSISGDGTAINSVRYADLDGLPGKELVVSWQMSEDVYLLSAYSLVGTEPVEMMKSAYTGYDVVDIDRDGRSEILLTQIDTSEGNSRVECYSGRDGMMELVTQAPLSSGVTALEKKQANYLAGLVPALYVTSVRAEERLVTDIFTFLNGELQNITRNEESGWSEQTERAASDVAGTDINSDYIVELPQLEPLPGEAQAEPFYVITWRQYDQYGESTAVATTFHNMQDGWYLSLPESWAGKISVQRNDTVTNSDSQRSITFSRWRGEGEKAEPFLTIYRFGGNNRSIRAMRGGRFVLEDTGDAIYAAEFYDTRWDCGLNQESLTERFSLILSTW